MKFELPVGLAYVLKSLDLCLYRDLEPLLDAKSYLQVPEIREFLALVKNAQMVLPTYDEILARHPAGVGTTRYWYRQYSKARRDLIAVLEKSIETDSPIRFKGL
jgi:hypothetical protein